MKKIVAITLMVLALIVAPAFAGERCNDSRIVEHGDSMNDVLAKCGEPVKVINYYNAFNALVGKEFLYLLGSGRFPRYFYFDMRSGGVTEISVGGKRQQ